MWWLKLPPHTTFSPDCDKKAISLILKEKTDDWSKWTLDRRRMYWGGVTMGSDKIRLVKRDRVCALEVWCEAFGGNIRDLKNAEARELNNIMGLHQVGKKATAV